MHKTPKGRLEDKTKEEVLATISFKSIKKTPKERVKLISSIDVFGFDRYNQSDFVEDKNKSTIKIYETEGTGNNKGRTLHQATVVLGKHIFWRFYSEHSNNEGYLLKHYMNHKL